MVSSITILNNLKELTRLSEFIELFGEQAELPVKVIFELNLCLDELITNVVSYGYVDEEAHSIEITINRESDTVSLEIIDDGISFNPLTKDPPDTTLPLEERQLGGLGIHLVKSVMSDYTYMRDGANNILKLIKRLN